MGAAASVRPKVLKTCLEIAKGRFTKKEILCLHSHFLSLSAIDDDDGVIDFGEFKACLGLKEEQSSAFVERIFQIFDKDGDGNITFSEFLEGLVVLCHKATAKEKLQFSFKIYDVDGDGKISRPELQTMMGACLKCFPIQLTAKQIATLIDTTFTEADTNKDGFIDFEEYSALQINHPIMLSQMSINVSHRIAELQKRGGDKSKKR